MARMLAESGGATGRRGAAALGLALALLAGSGCRRGSELVFRGAPVVLISVDTLRADHLPAYGYRAVATPNLDALRCDAVLFENAYSHVPLTLPSHTSIFTGLLPPQNGVRDNLGYALGPGPVTLSGLLKANGYATGGAVSAVILSHATGISRGFDYYDDNIEPTKINQPIARVQRGGSETQALLAEWIGGRADKPFFAFLHLFEPHTPYAPPEPYKSRYKLAYDGEIARADEIVGTFISFLRQRDLYDRSLIIFLSDHGEGLNEHGEDEHGVLLYREDIHVPLMVKFPQSRRRGETVKAPVALVDVFPTVAEVLGVPAPAGLAGRSLTATLPSTPGAAPAAAGPPRRIYGETLYPRLHLGWSDLASLIDDRNQYIQSPRSELYDIVADPEERHDLSAGLPPAFRSMRAELERMPRPLQPPGGSDPEQIKKLAALGYVSASAVDLSKRDLPSPRDRIGNVGELKAGFSALQETRYEDAVRIFGTLLKSEPGMTDVWQMYADACMRLGREKEALAALEEAARLSPGNPQVMMALSNHYLEMGNFAQAKRHAEAVGEAGSTSPHENLARIALAEGDLATAEREAKAALEKAPLHRIPHLMLARILHDRHDYAGALAELELAGRPRAGETASLQNLSFLRGDSLARLGRDAEAEAALRQEIRDFPQNPAPWTALAMLYASQGREEEARKALAELVKQHTPEAYFAAIRTYEVLGDPASAAALRTEQRRIFPDARELKSAAG